MSDPERPTKDMLRVALSEDFEVHDNWRGRHKHNGELVVYDLVLVPRSSLITRNFDDGYVVVEVKNFSRTDKKKHDVKVRDMMWQCVAYSFSDIELPDGSTKSPLFVLYYIAGDGVSDPHGDELTNLHHFVARGGVGRLGIEKSASWSMTFGGSYYFRKSHGRGPHNVGLKRQTGSSR